MMRKRSIKPLLLLALLTATLLGLLSTHAPTRLQAGENLDRFADNVIFDMVWDPRIFNGSVGFPGLVEWFHNPAGIPAGVTAPSFEGEVEAGFNNWEAVDDGLPEAPLVPIVNLAGQTAVTDAAALDGVNAVTWAFGAPNGVLASTPCWFLTAPKTTTDDGLGNALLPLDGGGTIPFPGPPNTTYPAGTAVDCGMEFDSADPWSTAAGPVGGQFDVQTIATHEGGHFIGLSHSTIGNLTGIGPFSATMTPFGAPGDIELRSLAVDDQASVLRTYARNATSPTPQTVGGRGVIRLTLKKGGACEPATGLSVIAYRTSEGLTGLNRAETFSGSQFRAGLDPDFPANGSVILNMPPLPAGESYTIYAHSLDDNSTGAAGAYSGFRYNNTTIQSNLLEPSGQSRAFDNLAVVSSLAAGETVDLGDVGILGCWNDVPGSSLDLVSQAVTAPAGASIGTQVSITSSFSNQGTQATGSFEAGIYLSTDPAINAGDTFTGFSCSVPSLSPGQNSSCDGLVNVPSVVPGDFYFGLLVDRLNDVGESSESNNGIAAANLTTISPNPLDPIVNGSFESGDFSGWTVEELDTTSSNPFLQLTVDVAGVEYPQATFIVITDFPNFLILDYFNSEPTDGQFAALHDWNGDDSTTSGPVNRRELYQDVTLPANATNLTFDYRAAWELFRFPPYTGDRTFSVEIEPAGGGGLLAEQLILSAPILTLEEDTANPSGEPGQLPAPPGSVDVSGFAGQAVRIKFVWNIPDPGTGFAFFQLDNVRLNTGLNTSPIVSITAPADSTIVTEGDSVGFTGTASDGEDGDISASLSWSSSIDGVIGSGASFSTSALSVGTHTITASVTDSLGAPGSDSITVTVDPPPNTAPTVTITAPANGSSVDQGELVSFTGTANDTEDGDLTASLAWTSSIDGIIGSGGSPSTATLSVGTHTITASVIDAGSLTGDASITLVVNAMPTISITAPGNGTSFNELESITFVGAANDAEDGDLSAGISWTSNIDGSIGTGASFSRTDLSVGTHTITAAITDSDNAGANDAITTTVNANGAPSVTITAPANGSAVNHGTSVNFTGTANDVEDGDLSAGLAWTSSIDGSIGSGASFSAVALSIGTHTITAAVNDVGGLQGSAATTLTINGPPTVSISSPASGSSSTLGDSVAFVGSADDGEGGDVSGTISWTSSLNGVLGSGASISASNLSLGTHTITAAVTDSGGLSDSDEISFTVNVNTIPTVAITSPLNGTSVTEGESVGFLAAASDTEDGDISTGLSWSSDLTGSIGSGASFSTSALTVGTHVVTASVTDSHGGSGSAVVNVTVNMVMPGETPNLATADFATARGTLTGDYTATALSDNVYEQLTEEQQGKNARRARSLLDHTWTFNVGAGSSYMFSVEAHHDGTEDDFVFSYSLDNSTFTEMLTVTKTSDDDTAEPYAFVEDVAGTVYVRVQDSDNTRGAAQLDTLFVDAMVITTVTGGGNTAPVVTITAPADGFTATADDSILFAGTASDSQDGNLSAGIEWTLGVGGPVIGSGASFSTAALGAGAHIVVASVTDSGSLQGSDSIDVTVNAAGAINLSASGFKVKGVHHADLTWSGALSDNVDVYRDNVKIGSPESTNGAFTDNTLTAKGGGVSYVYRVCEADTTVCSNDATVSF